MRFTILTLCLALSASLSPAWGGGPVTSGSADREAMRLVVYGNGMAQVEDVRRIDLPSGAVTVVFDAISPQLRPETVLLSGESLDVRAQSFRFDPLGQRRLLEEAVGQRVWVRRARDHHGGAGAESVEEGLLLSVVEGPVVRIGERIETPAPGDILFGELPAKLTPRPVLQAELQSGSAEARALMLRYLTGGISWRADYIATLDRERTRLDLQGFVGLTNQSGFDIEGATVRLLAGEVSQAGPQPLPRGPEMMAMAAEAGGAAADMSAARAESFSDRHLYSLPGLIGIARGEARQVGLLQADGVAVNKRFRLIGLVQPGRAPEEIGPLNPEIQITITNDEASGLGQPLPAGIVRIYQPLEATGSPVFVGAAPIRHTARGDEVELGLGRAFDISGRAWLTEFKRVSTTSGAYETGQRIELINGRDDPVTVEVVGQMPRGWRMLSETQSHEEESANRLRWDLDVPANGKASLEYRVRVTP